MEARIAAIEIDLRNVKETVAELCGGMKAANDGIAKLATGQAELRGEINTIRAELKGEINTVRTELSGRIDHLRAELKGDIGTVRAEMATLRAEMKALREEIVGLLSAQETKFMRFFAATVFSCASLAFSAAKLFS